MTHSGIAIDTTADAYMYAGVRMMADLWKALDHALLAAVVQLVGAGLGAWFLSEQWRQRRDFQAKTLARYSRLSADVMTQHSEILMNRGKVPEKSRQRLGIKYVRRRTALLALDVEFFGFFDDDVYGDLVYLKDLSRELHNMAFASTPVTRDRFEPVQNCFSAQRKVIGTKMFHRMGFISNADLEAVLAEWQPRARALPPGVTLPTGAEP